jgi:Tfp pilus assembly protein PilF
MALAKLVCGDCGGVLAPSDVRCPTCGASIEREESPSGTVTCNSCGHANPPGGEFCSSCGARLSLPASRRSRRGGKDLLRPRKRGKPPVTWAGVWQIISVVAVLALLSYLVYTQIHGEKSPAPRETAAPQAGLSLQRAVPPMVDLTPLEDAVRLHPSDATLQLRLANALHDGGMLSRAIDAYGKYLAMRPKNPDARTDMGICYFQLAQADSLNRESLLLKAASVMEEAFNTATRPHQPSAFNLGVVYLHLSDLQKSNSWFRKAVQIDPASDLGKRAQNMITQHTLPQ